MIILTIVFFLRVRLRTLCAQWTCHVLWTCLPRIPTFRITCHRFVYSYIPVPISRVSLTVQIWTVDSSPDTCLSSVSLFVSSTCMLTFVAYAFPLSFCRLISMLTITAYAFPFVVCRLVSRLVISGLWLITESFPFLVSLYLYLAYYYIYGLEMWACSPSSIYFATTLKVWPARSHVLSLSSLVRWPRLLLCDS